MRPKFTLPCFMILIQYTLLYTGCEALCVEGTVGFMCNLVGL